MTGQTSGGFFRKIRILILLYVLLMVACTAWLARARSTDWDDPLAVTIYPINGDGSETTQDHIQSLSVLTFKEIEDFFNEEAERYGLALKTPVDIGLAPEIKEIPPPPPRNRTALSVMVWSLKLRYWSWSRDNYKYPKDIQIFVLYFDPETRKTVAHSLGLQKGLIGIVNAFSSEKMDAENNVVIAHELLHTVGATDKYEPRTNMPLYPIGYAEPELDPVLPQEYAEIMAGRIPINENKAEAPRGLEETVIGEATAIEIRWLAGN